VKKIVKKLSDILRMVFGYGILITLFAGAGIFFGYVLALCIGGDTAALICGVIYQQIVPVMVKATTSLVLLGLVIMYLSGEVALTVSAGKKEK